jgi:hypothetical protein
MNMEEQMEEHIKKLKLSMKDYLLGMFKDIDSNDYFNVNYYYFTLRSFYSGHDDIRNEIEEIKGYHDSRKE